MSILFPVLVYFVINWLGMSDNAGFFDIVTILPHVLVLLVGKMAENGSKLTKIKVYLENPQNADPEKCFFFTPIISSVRVHPNVLKAAAKSF